MLKQNGTIFAQYPVRRFGGAFCQERQLFGRTDGRNWMVGEHAPDRKSGRPDGTLHPGSWLLPGVAGGMASRNNIAGAGATTFAVTGGVNGQATLAGAGDIMAATAQLVISMVATLAGSGTMAAADLRGYLNAVASLSGSGGVSAAIAALAWAGAAVSGGGTISSATPYATGTLSATIRGYSDLTPEGIRDQVWNATAANYTGAGTMGQKLNSAASGGVDYNALAAAVWSAATRTLTSGAAPTEAQIAAAVHDYIVEAGFSFDEVVRIMAAALAGTSEKAGSTITFKGLDGATDRIVGSFDAQNNRTGAIVNGD